MSVGLSVCRSVPNEFYRSVMLLLVYICCYYYCSLDYKNILLSYFAFLAAVAALQFTVSVSSKLHTIYKLVMFMSVVINNHLDDVFATYDIANTFVHKNVVNCNRA